MPPFNGEVDRLIREVAARAIMPRFRNLAASEVEEKMPGELVTVADREAERLLHDGLVRIAPGVAIVGEEAVAADAAVLDRLRGGEAWVIDPIDGTANFAAGRAPFGIMVALVRDGAGVASWIYDPLRDRMCRAERGGGAFVDERRVRTAPPPGARRVAGLASQFLSPPARERLEAAAAASFTLAPIPRCAAEQYARLCLGGNDIGLFQRSLAWDHAAGALLLEEAGGRVARWDGAPYLLNDGRSGLLAAATPALWDEAAAILFGPAAGLDRAGPPPLAC